MTYYQDYSEAYHKPGFVYCIEAVGLLLPCNEYNDRARFEQQFRSMLSLLKFRSQSWKVNLSLFLCLPEGSGLAHIRCEENAFG